MERDGWNPRTVPLSPSTPDQTLSLDRSRLKREAERLRRHCLCSHASASRERISRTRWFRRGSWWRKRGWIVREGRRSARRGGGSGRIPARLRRRSLVQTHQRQSAVLQRTYLPPKQNPSGESGRDPRTHQQSLLHHQDGSWRRRLVLCGWRQVLHLHRKAAPSRKIPAEAERCRRRW